MRKSSGFTLIELLVYVGIFALVSGIFVSILVIALRVQGQQGGLVEVSSQLNFAMRTIQGHIREANAVTSPSVGATSNLLNITKPSGIFVMSVASCEGVSDAICFQGGGVNSPLTTGQIKVTNLEFKHFTTPSNHPSFPDISTVQITITAENKTDNPAQKATRTLQSSASPLGQ